MELFSALGGTKVRRTGAFVPPYSFEQEQAEINAVDGKYYVKLFSDFASGKYEILNMYESIANFANRHNLTIVNIAKPEDGFMRDGVTVIFK